MKDFTVMTANWKPCFCRMKGELVEVAVDRERLADLAKEFASKELDQTGANVSIMPSLSDYLEHVVAKQYAGTLTVEREKVVLGDFSEDYKQATVKMHSDKFDELTAMKDWFSDNREWVLHTRSTGHLFIKDDELVWIPDEVKGLDLVLCPHEYLVTKDCSQFMIKED